jgi:hypothetical protein
MDKRKMEITIVSLWKERQMERREEKASKQASRRVEIIFRTIEREMPRCQKVINHLANETRMNTMLDNSRGEGKYDCEMDNMR